jgi:hypothetical protein
VVAGMLVVAGVSIALAVQITGHKDILIGPFNRRQL